MPAQRSWTAKIWRSPETTEQIRATFRGRPLRPVKDARECDGGATELMLRALGFESSVRASKNELLGRERWDGLLTRARMSHFTLSHI